MNSKAVLLAEDMASMFNLWRESAFMALGSTTQNKAYKSDHGSRKALAGRDCA